MQTKVTSTYAKQPGVIVREKPQGFGSNRTGCGNETAERAAIIAEACGISYAEADAIAYAAEFDPVVDELAEVLP